MKKELEDAGYKVDLQYASNDVQTQVSQVVKMVDSVMQGGEAEINDTKSYDNGTEIIPSYLCDPVVVTVDNYKDMLITSGYYTEDQLK
ncbi:hypothetical protein ABFV83_19260 [Lacrimispora sp. BS-2]|uniref:Periplasmic binding protein domain-containing protein n=1 Tax=Lacrimispora sp. BS-2 TaxID=3151850 RepID=A0AAU7PQ64_9FIRM